MEIFTWRLHLLSFFHYLVLFKISSYLASYFWLFLFSHFLQIFRHYTPLIVVHEILLIYISNSIKQIFILGLLTALMKLRLYTTHYAGWCWVIRKDLNLGKGKLGSANGCCNFTSGGYEDLLKRRYVMKDLTEVTERSCMGRVFQANRKARARPSCGRLCGHWRNSEKPVWPINAGEQYF